MKKLLVLATAALAASPAMASKARVNALGGSPQLLDVQNVYTSPYALHALGEQVTFERGVSGETGTHAEGGFVKKGEMLSYGVFLGHRNENAFTNSITAGYLKEQNPLNVAMAMKAGDFKVGAGLGYSNGKNDTDSTKTAATTLSLGASNDVFDVDFNMGLSGKAEKTGGTVEAKSLMDLGVAYNMSETHYLYAKVGMSKVDTTAGATTTEDKTAYELGFVNTLVKNDDANFFYGVAYKADAIKDGVQTSALPVWMGIEANATSWMVMRASVKQNILLNSTKAADGKVTDIDSISFAAGAGVKLGKGMVDATFSNTDADASLANFAYTYNF